MKVTWEIHTGYPTAKHHGSWEVPEDITDEELDDMLQQEVQNLITVDWKKI